MQRAAKSQTNQTHATSPAAERATLRTSGEAEAYPRAGTAIRRSPVDWMHTSPRMAAQGVQLEGIQTSPRLVAQRKSISSRLGNASQFTSEPEPEEPLQGMFTPLQRQGGLEEEALLQGKREPAQRQGHEEGEVLQGKLDPKQRQSGPKEVGLLQGKFAPVQCAEAEPDRESRENKTGLPDNLKAGIEALSGMTLDQVKVHYNSAQPAQLNALAYAQGNDIHIAPGQEQHLPHEAWHVVQQGQGRVQPRMQMKDGVPVNDNAALEHEADVMGAMALDAGASNDSQSIEAGNWSTSVRRKPSANADTFSQNQVAQLDREYDATLSPHKAKLMDWLVDSNQTLGLNQAGDSSNAASNKKSNFGWHHILAFAELSKHGEGKTSPANHGGNLRLGPMKNRMEPSDVSGGTAVDYSYLPLDKGGNIVLDDYSKGIFGGTITASDKSSLDSVLKPDTNKETPQAKYAVKGQETNAFSEWFLESTLKAKLLSKEAISGKLAGAEKEKIDFFVREIDKRFDSLLRTYKYYNKNKEVQIRSGVPMTDISEGKFGDISVKTKEGAIKASTVIDELLRDQKWVQRGSQGELQDESTTYKFGLASFEPFTTLVEEAVRKIDLTGYREAKIGEFKSTLEGVFETFRESGKQSENFSQGKETTLIAALAENLNGGAEDFEALWNGIEDDAVDGQYVKVKIDDEVEYWEFPVPEVTDRRSAITTTTSTEHSEVADAWGEVFVSKLGEWDNETPLFDEDAGPDGSLYIEFKDVGKSISSNEQKWPIKEINEERKTSDKRNSALPRNFLTEKMTVGSVQSAVVNHLSENSEEFLSTVKEAIGLAEFKEELRPLVSPHFNVCSKLLKGIEKDLDKRRTAFGSHLEGFVNSTKWHVINGTTIPSDVAGTQGKKWAELGAVQQTLYKKWLVNASVEKKIADAATSEKLGKALP